MRIIGGSHLRAHDWTHKRYRAAFHLAENVPTCTRGMSANLRQHAHTRIGTHGFAEPPADAGGPRRRPAEWRSLAQIAPELVSELHPERNGKLDPSSLAAGSKRRLWWLCPTCGHAWQATPVNRVGRRSGCPRCAAEQRAHQRARVAQARSLAAQRPDLAQQLDPHRNPGTRPDTIGVFSSRKVWWLCPTCHHTWQATPANRARGGTGCPNCWHHRRHAVARTVPHERSLAVRKPELLDEIHPTRNPGLDPTQLGTKSDQKIWWRCPRCGHEWQARVADRSSGSRCPACARA
jgi:rubrerythrin